MTIPESILSQIEKPVRDLAKLVAAYQAGALSGIPAGTAFELDVAMDTIDEDESYAGELLGVAIALIADTRARAFFKQQFGLEIVE